jgi:CDP-paratose 2-epimerase
MRVFITGGAGFIGSNTAEYHLEKADEVFLLDNLSRKGAEANLKWLKSRGKVAFFREDICDSTGLSRAIREAGHIDLFYHFAAQVAVTTSVRDPRTDFNVNALGAFNVLEAVREAGIDPVMIFSSTNKVYGQMPFVKITEKEDRYEYENLPEGVSENRQLDFHSPYGCSKGSADQYFIDYSRIYGLRTVCMRQSCIYGPRQFGIEDQGWVAWFIIAAQAGRPVTIYGDGKQVRDILHVRDLIELYTRAYENIDKVKGKAFNVGGGKENRLSLLELVKIIEAKTGKKLNPQYKNWRPGDQKIYISDISRIKETVGWEPSIGKQKGISLLWDWVEDNMDLFRNL